MEEIKIKRFMHLGGKDLIMYADRASFEKVYASQNVWCMVDEEGTAWVLMESANGVCEKYDEQPSIITKKPTRSRRVLSKTKQ